MPPYRSKHRELPSTPRPRVNQLMPLAQLAFLVNDVGRLYGLSKILWRQSIRFPRHRSARQHFLCVGSSSRAHTDGYAQTARSRTFSAAR